MPKAVQKKSDMCRFNMELSRADMEAVKKSSRKAGLSMSGWVRTVLRKAMARQR